MGSYFPDQELNPCILQRKFGVLTTRLLGSLKSTLLYIHFVACNVTESTYYFSLFFFGEDFSSSMSSTMTVLLIPFQMKCLYFLSDCCGWNFHYFVTEKWQEWACLFYLILKEKLFSFSPLSIILAVDLSLLYSVSCV